MISNLNVSTSQRLNDSNVQKLFAGRAFVNRLTSRSIEIAFDANVVCILNSEIHFDVGFQMWQIALRP